MAKDVIDSASGRASGRVEGGPIQHEDVRLTSSDGEEEKSTRERFKKTSIAGMSQQTGNGTIISPTADVGADNDVADTTGDDTGSSRGRPAKKRSFEDLVKDDVEADSALAQPPSPKSGHHKRMRSRDVGSGDHAEAFGRIAEEITREETDPDAQTAPGGPGVIVDVTLRESLDTGLPQKNDPKPTPLEKASDDDTAATNIPVSSGFANASAASPFTARAPTKPSSTTTPASAFASSGLSAFASSSSSPFGAASIAKSSSGFASTSVASPGFGGSQSTSSFGSLNSGFGGSSSAFASSTTSGAFGAPKPFGSSFGTAKPFGTSSAGFSGGAPPAPFGSGKDFGGSASKKVDEDDEDEAEENGDETAVNEDDSEAQQDPRFKEQHSKSRELVGAKHALTEVVVDTGEENETTDFSCRAKLYYFAGAGVGWKERGVGTFKINTSEVSESLSTAAEQNASTTDPEAGFRTVKRKARLIMRADGVHRVVLNSPMFKGMKFGDAEGNEPFGKLMHLQSLESGKPVPLQIRVSKDVGSRRRRYTDTRCRLAKRRLCASYTTDSKL